MPGKMRVAYTTHFPRNFWVPGVTELTQSPDPRLPNGSIASCGVAAKVTTPWGPATVVEELSLPQRAGDKRFASIVQVLEDERGGRLVRFAYSTGGTARRGPVTLRARDLERLASSLAEHPALQELLPSS